MSIDKLKDWEIFMEQYKAHTIDPALTEATKYTLPEGAEITLRLEREGDYRENEEMTRAAFWKESRYKDLGGSELMSTI